MLTKLVDHGGNGYFSRDLVDCAIQFLFLFNTFEIFLEKLSAMWYVNKELVKERLLVPIHDFLIV